MKKRTIAALICAWATWSIFATSADAADGGYCNTHQSDPYCAGKPITDPTPYVAPVAKPDDVINRLRSIEDAKKAVIRSKLANARALGRIQAVKQNYEFGRGKCGIDNLDLDALSDAIARVILSGKETWYCSSVLIIIMTGASIQMPCPFVIDADAIIVRLVAGCSDLLDESHHESLR